MKTCTSCKETKEVSEFPKSKQCKSGIFPHCKTCNTARSTAWAKAHPERYRETQRLVQAEYRAKHPEKIAAKYKRWRDSHIESARERVRLWIAADPQRDVAKKHRRRARLKGSGGDFTSSEARELRASYLGRCVYCFEATKTELDHVIPVASGGSSDINNIAPACSHCNRSKGSKSLLQFMMRKAG